MDRNEQTYVDDGRGVRYCKHKPEPVRAFEMVLNCADRASNLTLGTPDGRHEISMVLRAHRQGEMQRVLRVEGGAAPDGRLQVTVTNEITGASQVIEL